VKRKQRRRLILDLLETEAELSLAEVCRHLASSEATVRREFVELVKEGCVERTWGGIRRMERSTALGPPAFALRLGSEAEAKAAIAKAAAALLRDGDVVMIDGGTTTYQLCPFLAQRAVRVITNSLAIAYEMDRLKGDRRGAEILLCGGVLQPESGVVAGRPAEAFLKRYRSDWVFLSAAGVDTSTVTNYDEAVLACEQLMIQQSRKVALLADGSKLGRQAMSLLCPISTLDVLITAPSEEHRPLLDTIAKAGVAVTEASPGRPLGNGTK
jgi:DeoR family fructose operon transcriptional repressor